MPPKPPPMTVATSSSNSVHPESEAVVYMCRKCPGKEIKGADKEAHRQMHRDRRTTRGEELRAAEKAARKPGPKSRRPRRESPHSSLFLAAAPMPKKRRERTEPVLEDPGSSPDPDEVSPEARKQRGRVLHWKHAKKLNMRFNSG